MYRGQTLDTYLYRLAQVRARTLAQFAFRDDAWLQEEWTLADGTLVNHHWAWFHVFEDELSHRGQMLLIHRHLLPDALSIQ